MSEPINTKTAHLQYLEWSEEKLEAYHRWKWSFLLKSSVKFSLKMGLLIAFLFWLTPLIEPEWLRLTSLFGVIVLGTIALGQYPDLREMGQTEFSTSYDSKNGD